ncbi:Ig-like domain repeat protein, partial [Methanobrevibacter sp.]|uniref:Ig-like domain repeat protein n=1 Tax=Methanobrevibacter sp. TaxID=66852 RepID=UPI002E75ED52
GNVYRNNTLYGNTNFNPSANSIVENNKIYATTNIAANTTVDGNTFKNVAISGTNTTFANNIVTGTVTVSGNENTIVDNTVMATSSEYAIDLKSTVNNTVTDNLLYASELAGDAAVKHGNENNTISHNYPFESVLIVEADDITVGQDAIVNIRFSESVEGTVEVILNGKKYDVDVIDGKGQLNVSDLSANKYTVGVYFSGDLKYSPIENSTDFTVEKLDAQVNVTVPSEVEAGEEVAIDIAIPGATGNVSVFVDDVEAVVALDENGTAQFIIPSAEPGEHSVVVVYSGDDTHAVASNTVQFTVDPEFYMDIDADAIYGEDAIVEINLPEDATGNLTVTIGNETYIVPVEDGYASVEIPDLAYGEHNITVAYSGDDKYKAASKESTIDVQPDIEIPDEIDFNDEDEISITLPEDATGNLTVSVDGVETTVPVVNGTASVPLGNLTPGDHNISVSYSGDEKYDSASAEKSLSVVPGIEIPEDITTGDDDSISIDLPADATGNLTVSVDGVETTVPVVNGTASVPLGELSAGDHNITVSYSGDSKYAAYSKSVTAAVAKVKPTIDVTVPANAQEGKVVSITIALPDDATGTVFVDIDGNGYYTNVNGTTVLKISGLTGGDKNITYRYTGDDKYEEASGNLSAFILFKPKLTGSKNFAMQYFDGSKYKVRAWGTDGKVAAGEVVTITLNKKTYKVKTNKNGVAALKIPNTVKPTKKYTITAQYKTAKVSNKIGVKQILKASNKNVKKSAKKLVLSAALNKVKGKYLKGKVIKFKFNGKTYKAKTNKKGVAKVTIKKNVINKLKAGKKYTVKITYYKDTISKKVTVKR